MSRPLYLLRSRFALCRPGRAIEHLRQVNWIERMCDKKKANRSEWAAAETAVAGPDKRRKYSHAKH